MKRGTASKLNLFVFLVALIVIVSRAEFRWSPEVFTGKCVGVSDGDTISVMYERQEVKVRLWGIDSPEKRQPFGKVAKKFASDHTLGKTVDVEIKDRDRYGRIVGWVTLPDKRVLNIELVRYGLAWWYREYAPKNALLEALERDARDAGLGLWQDKNPIPPWKFRNRNKASAAAKRDRL